MNTLDDKCFKTILFTTLLLGTIALVIPNNSIERIQENAVSYHHVSTNNQMATVVIVGKRLPKQL